MTRPAIRAAIEPTDRSMPPEMITKHIPTAMIPMKAVRVSTLVALPSDAKSGLSSAPATHSSASPRTGPRPPSRSAKDGRPGASVLRSSRMRDQLLLGQLLKADRGLHAAAAHHHDP